MAAQLNSQRTRFWSAPGPTLERHRGWFGLWSGGPGETQIGTLTVRAIDEQACAFWRLSWTMVGPKPRALHRARAAKVPFPDCPALSAHTNVRYRRFFNRMTGPRVMAKDMLFGHAGPDDAQLVVARWDRRLSSAIPWAFNL